MKDVAPRRLPVRSSRRKAARNLTSSAASQTHYGHSDRLRGLDSGRKIVMMSPSDMKSAGLDAASEVTLVTDLDDGHERRVSGLKAKRYDLPAGALVGYFPELNALAPRSRRDVASPTPASKAISVRIETTQTLKDIAQK